MRVWRIHLGFAAVSTSLRVRFSTANPVLGRYHAASVFGLTAYISVVRVFVSKVSMLSFDNDTIIISYRFVLDNSTTTTIKREKPGASLGDRGHSNKQQDTSIISERTHDTI